MRAEKASVAGFRARRRTWRPPKPTSRTCGSTSRNRSCYRSPPVVSCGGGDDAVAILATPFGLDVPVIDEVLLRRDGPAQRPAGVHALTIASTTSAARR